MPLNLYLGGHRRRPQPLVVPRRGTKGDGTGLSSRTFHGTTTLALRMHILIAPRTFPTLCVPSRTQQLRLQPASHLYRTCHPHDAITCINVNLFSLAIHIPLTSSELADSRHISLLHGYSQKKKESPPHGQKWLRQVVHEEHHLQQLRRKGCSSIRCYH